MGMLEMGVVLHGMKLTALHPVKRKYDTQRVAEHIFHLSQQSPCAYL